jgi:acyl-CoA synthetase (NDP forming)
MAVLLSHQRRLVLMLLRIVMRDCRRTDAGQDRMAMENAVLAVFGQRISADTGAGGGRRGMAMEPAMVRLRGLGLCRHCEDAGQSESTGESEGDMAFTSDII